MLFKQEALGAGYLAKVGPLQIKTTNLQCKIKHNSSFECTRSDRFTNTEVGQMVGVSGKSGKSGDKYKEIGKTANAGTKSIGGKHGPILPVLL
jgi:hypothetical protein